MLAAAAEQALQDRDAEQIKTCAQAHRLLLLLLLPLPLVLLLVPQWRQYAPRRNDQWRNNPAAARSKCRARGRWPNSDPKWLHNIWLLPEAALLMCAIPKNGLTVQSKLAAQVQQRWPVGQKRTAWLSAAHWKKSDRHVRSLFHANSSWRRLVIVRDPIERFVSAFNSKCAGGDKDGAKHCTRYFGETPTLLSVARGLEGGQTPPGPLCRGCQKGPASENWHWTPQNRLCGGLLDVQFGLSSYTHVVPFPHLGKALGRLFGPEAALQAASREAARHPSHITHANVSAVDAETLVILRRFYACDLQLYERASATFASAWADETNASAYATPLVRKRLARSRSRDG